MKRIVYFISLFIFIVHTACSQTIVPKIEWDSRSLIIDGHRVVPVMGELHYSRVPAEEWATEIGKMHDGGVTMIACYVFWNHIEEVEGQYDWSGQRNLRRFLELCKAADMPVVLRVGPFCHGEARCGGIPDWVFDTGCKTRSEDSQFLSYVTRFYRQIFTQVQGLQWKDGGPVMAMQFDNEYRGRASYLLSLKRIATEIGFALPFYTRTGWPELATQPPYGELLPLYGDYADGFWDRSTSEGVGDYYKAFNFKAFRTSTAIASEQLNYEGQNTNNDGRYPYFTCELGGGMMTSYHRRIYIYPIDAYSLAVVKLGSGSNLLGYYMYHGGTNPVSNVLNGSDVLKPYDGDRHIYLNETQRSRATNYNDLPVMTYDFQAPIGEFGQLNPHYFMLRKLHIFLHDFGESLAPMDAVFPCKQDVPQRDDTFLRWSYRSLGDSAFVFVNNYERFANLTDKKNVVFNINGLTFPSRPITIPASTACIFPVGIAGLKYATANIVARRESSIYLEKVDGVPSELAFADGKTLKNVQPRGTEKPIYTSRSGLNYYLVDSETAGRLFLDNASAYVVSSNASSAASLHWQKTHAASNRTITIGVNKAAQAPLDSDFDHAATYIIDLPAERTNALLDIEYYGDCARLYAGDRLIDDTFYNGRHFMYALWRIPQDIHQLTLRILPIQADMPVYFPREAHVDHLGEEVISIKVASLR